MNNRFYIITKYIFNLFISNLFFLIFISPFILYILFSDDISKFVALILSFTLGSALTTLFSVMGKLLREGDINPARDFLHFYKANFFQGTIVGIIMNFFIGIIYFDVLYFGQKGSNELVYIMLIILGLFMLIGIYVYPIMSRYNIRTFYLFKLSLEILLKKIYLSLTCFAIIIITLWFIRFTKISLVGLLFGTSVLCYTINAILRKAIDELQERIQEKYE